MSEHIAFPNHNPGGQNTLQSWPISAVQAMYHAVTGKTESISKELTRNVHMSLDDLRILHTKIMQKREHFKAPAPPTVTVVAKMHNNQSFRYSSWERFQMLEVASNDITSELSIKYEFLIQLPDVETIQRCIINVTIDSKLPMLKEDIEQELEDDFYYFMTLDRIPTLGVRVEFVDFLIGKEFQQIIEEWFNQLPEVRSPRWAVNLSKMGRRKIAIFSNINYLAISLYLFIVPKFYPMVIVTVNDAIVFAATACALFLVSRALTTQIAWLMAKHISTVVVPSLVVFTRGDKDIANMILERQKKSKAKIFGVVGLLQQIWQ